MSNQENQNTNDDLECKNFINKLKSLPAKIRQYKIIGIGNFVLVKAQSMADYLSVIYKEMPEIARNARKKGMKSSYKSFLILEKIDKMFISENFPVNMGFAIINTKTFEEILKELYVLIPEDEIKLKNLLNDQQ